MGTLDIVAIKFSDLLHYFEHFRHYLLQDICRFADNFVCDRVRQRQDALQLIQQARWHPITFVLFLHELNEYALPLLLIRQYRARTSTAILATPRTAFATG